MSDFKVQFVEGLIPGTTATLNVDSPVFQAVSEFTKAFMIPAVSVLQTAGIGTNDGTVSDTLDNVSTKVRLTDIDTIQFDDGNAASSENNIVGAWLLEYLGPVGGVNEVIVRDVKVFGSSAGTFDSTTISGIVSLAKCVPFVTYEATINNANPTGHSAQVEVVNDGVNNVVRVTKVNTTDTLNLVVYVVEFVGSNWAIQKVTHTFTAGATNQDVVITAVVLADTFLYTTWKATGTRPDHNNYWVWLANTTTLRHRVFTLSGSPVAVTYIISNPQMNVEVVGSDPDGTSDLAAGGAAPETRTVAYTAISDLTAALVLGYAGSDHNTALNRVGMLNLINLQDADTIQLRRSLNVGATDSKLQVIDLSAVIGLNVDSITPIVDGSNFTITGNFGTVTGVTLGGVTQAAVSGNATQIVRTGTLSTLKYGVYDLIINAGGQIIISDIAINPPATKNFVNLGTLITSVQRLTSTTDIVSGDQIEWGNVVGGVIGDVSVFADASFSSVPAVTAFDFRVNDGTGWGVVATQTINNQASDALNSIRDIVTDFTRLTTFVMTNIEHDT